MKNIMFGDKKKKLTDSERSLISETVSIEGTINSSGAIDVAGLIKGPVFSKEIIIRETGSITGSIEGDHVEIHGHLDGKVSAQNIVIGATGTVKGDIEFGNNLKTENGADIDGYIKKTNKSKSTLTGDFLFKKKDKKETFFPPCPDPNSKLRVGSFANEKRLEKVKEFKYNEDKTQCLTIWEDVTYVDQWLPEPTLVINTVIIASIAATSPALINIIKGITKNIMKKITSSQGSKKNDNASQSD